MSELPLSTPESVNIPKVGLVQPETSSNENNIVKKIAASTLSGIETFADALKDKEKRGTILALGVLGVATTIADYKGYARTWPEPFAFFRDSDRHFEVGYISALLASKKEYASKRNKVGGMLLAGAIGNAVTETVQSVVVVGFLQDRWKHIGDFLLPAQVFWNNTQDAAAATLAAGYAAFREQKIVKSKFEKHETNVEVGLAEKPLHGEDHSLVDNEQKLYGVFDGLGGLIGAKIASKAASIMVQGSMEDYANGTDPNIVLDAIKTSLNDVNSVLVNELRGSATTAVVAKIVDNDKGSVLVWASVGDSRIYYKNADSVVVQLSKDEGVGHMLSNCLGVEPGAFKGVNQSGILPIKSGDQFVLVSDGITGDYEPDLLTNQDIDSALVNSGNAQLAAENLIKISRKYDDKTAIVVRCV